MNRRSFLVATTSGLLTAIASPKPCAASDPEGLQTFGSIGKERTILEAGKEVELYHHEGKGCLTHLWFAMDERTRILIYVDGEAKPSIDMATDLGLGYAF